MKFVAQRVGGATLSVDGQLVSEIGHGLVVYFGVKVGDTQVQADKCVEKIANLRIFEDEEGKMNLSVKDVSGEVLFVSQFTLYGDARKGNRPSFIGAARPETAIPLYESVIAALRESVHVETGVFGADMKVSILNDGPVTILLDSKKNY